MNNYEDIIKKNLRQVYSRLPEEVAEKIPATRVDDSLLFSAFGESCRITPESITLGDNIETGPTGIVISLYALQVDTVACQLTPFKAFREMPDSMPYVGAFASHTERTLVDHIDEIELKADWIAQQFKGSRGARKDAGDFSFTNPNPGT